MKGSNGVASLSPFHMSFEAKLYGQGAVAVPHLAIPRRVTVCLGQ